MKRSILGIAIIIFSLAGCNTVSDSIIIDGKLDILNEWKGAKEIKISDEFSLHVKETKENYFLALSGKEVSHFYVDLFVQTETDLVNFHASMKLSQRIIVNSFWNDTTPVFEWDNNKYWEANTIKIDRAKKDSLNKENYAGNAFMESILPYNAIEFKFSKQEWDFNNANFMLTINDLFLSTEEYPVIYPDNSGAANKERWITLFD